MSSKTGYFITFQPYRLLKKMKTGIKSTNTYLEDFKNALGYTPIFAIRIDDKPIEAIIAESLLSYPRCPQVALVFEKDLSDVQAVSRLDVFKYDYISENADNSNGLYWKSSEDDKIKGEIKIPYTDEGIKDYLVNEINAAEMRQIYLVGKNFDSISYEDMYKYSHIDFVQWAIESLTLVVDKFVGNVDIAKVPKVDTNTPEFMDKIHLIFNQLMYKPDRLSESNFMNIENIIEEWLYGTTNQESLLRFKKLSESEKENGKQVENNNYGLNLDSFSFIGNYVQAFGH